MSKKHNFLPLSSLVPSNSNSSINNNAKRSKTMVEFNINEHRDILVEILKRLDGRSLGVATCVCRLWSDLVTRDDTIWEHVCFRHVSPPGVRALVLALGGYKHLYVVCVKPVLGRLMGRVSSGRVKRKRVDETEFGLAPRVWTRQGAQLLMSLFCVDYYEKLEQATIVGNDNTASFCSRSSLMYLCKENAIVTSGVAEFGTTLS